jgi:8-oxo-dGTP diphosphatase
MKQIECIARGLATRDGLVLACRSVKHGYRYLPGGHVEFGESAADALAREFLEETGLRVVPGEPRLVAEVRFGKHHEVNTVFHVEHADGPWPERVESLEPKLAFDWLPMETLLGDSGRLRPAAIRDWLGATGGLGPLGYRSDAE